MGFMYMYLMGSMIMIGGNEWSCLGCFVALFVPHLLQSSFVHIGNLRDNANYLMPGQYSLAQQQAVIDALILVMLLMAGLQYFNKLSHDAATRKQ